MEPDPKRMPLNYSDFPEEVQLAFFMYSILPDSWDGASGSYMGKDWASCEHLFSVWEIEDKKTVLIFMKIYERIVVEERAKKQQQERKKAEKKQKASSGGGKKFSHNIQG